MKSILFVINMTYDSDTLALAYKIDSWRLKDRLYRDAYTVRIFQSLIAEQDAIAACLLKRCLFALRHPASMKTFIETYGVDRFLTDWPKQDGCKIVTYETTPAGSLVELKHEYSSSPQVWLVVTDTTTGSRHVIRVAPYLRSVHDALAWSFGLDPKDYHPAQES